MKVVWKHETDSIWIKNNRSELSTKIFKRIVREWKNTRIKKKLLNLKTLK